jgi:DNA-binding protein HU-beta
LDFLRSEILDLASPMQSDTADQRLTIRRVAVASVTKADLVGGVAAAANVTKAEAEKVMTAFFDAVKTNAKKGNKVAWPGFGSFSLTRRAARTGRNPRTGAAVRIRASNAVKFTSSASLKDAVNNRRPAASKATAAKAPAKKAAAKKTTAKKAPAKKATTAKKSTARKTAAKK